MERKQIHSKFIHSIGYNSERRILEVEFLRKQEEHKRGIYRYFDVPHWRYLELMGMNQPEGHSISAYFLTYIRPNFKFEKVEEKHEDETQESSEDDFPPEAA